MSIEWSPLEIGFSGTVTEWLQQRPVRLVACSCVVLQSALREALGEAVLHLFCNTSSCVTDLEFFRACKNDLRFPDHFGMNWHAFNDCIREFDFLREDNIVIAFCGFERFASSNPDGAANAIEICQMGKRYSEKGLGYFFCAQ